jgi:Secretion system C-terminal sorting domain
MLKIILLSISITITFTSCIYLAAEDTPASNNSTVLSFVVPAKDSAVVVVYNLLGYKVTQKTFHQTGLHRVSINAFHIPAGIYLVRITTSRWTATQKAYVIR